MAFRTYSGFGDPQAKEGLDVDVIDVIVLLPARTAGTLNQSLRRHLQYVAEHGFRPTLVVENWPAEMAGKVELVVMPSWFGRLNRFVRQFSCKILPRTLQSTGSNKSIPWPSINSRVPFTNDSWLHELAALAKTGEYVIRIGLWLLRQRLRGRFRNAVIWGYERPGALVGWILSRLLRLPLVASYQGTVLYPWLEARGRLRTFLRLPFDYVATAVKADLVIMTDDGTRGDDVLRRLGHSPERILFLPNGVDTRELAPLQHRRICLHVRAREPFLFVVASRLELWKRIDRALHVAAALKRRGLDFRLRIIGDGPLREALLDLAVWLDAADKIEFAGRLPYTHTLETIAAADMLWSFCDHSNLTNSVQEAVALGVPVLTLADGSLGPLTGHGLIIQVPMSEKFAEDSADVVLLALRRPRRAAVGNSIPTWEARARAIARALVKLVNERYSTMCPVSVQPRT